MKRKFSGIVVSDKMAKTIVVAVEEIKKHSKYFRRYKVQKRFKVHDPKKQAKTGDRVIFEECRPISRDKKWQLIEIIK